MRARLISGESRGLHGTTSNTGPSTSGAESATAQSETHLAISTPASESDCDGVDSLDRFDNREPREEYEDDDDDDEWTRSGTGGVLGIRVR